MHFAEDLNYYFLVEFKAVEVLLKYVIRQGYRPINIKLQFPLE